MYKFLTLVILFLLSRVIPHPPNFTPLLSVALFAPVLIPNSRVIATILTLSAVILSDLMLGFAPSFWGNYLSIIYIAWVAYGKPLNQLKPTIKYGLFASTVFYCVSNLQVWMTTALYPTNFSGLLQCYLAAIPFFINTIAATTFFSLLFANYPGQPHLNLRSKLRLMKSMGYSVSKAQVWRSQPSHEVVTH